MNEQERVRRCWRCRHAYGGGDRAGTVRCNLLSDPATAKLTVHLVRYWTRTGMGDCYGFAPLPQLEGGEAELEGSCSEASKRRGA